MPAGRFVLATGYLPGGDGAAIQGLIASIEAATASSPAAIFVDTAARAGVGLDENNAKDMGMLAAHLEALGEKFSCPFEGQIESFRGPHLARGPYVVPAWFKGCQVKLASSFENK